MSYINNIINFVEDNKESICIDLTPTYIKIFFLFGLGYDNSDIIIHFNKFLIKDTLIEHKVYKEEYDYVQLFYKLNEIKSFMCYNAKHVYEQMQIEQRDTLIDLLLEDD